MLVVLESTITPRHDRRDGPRDPGGRVRACCRKDFALAHAPERVMVGRLLRNIREHDRVVGGIDEVSTRRAVELYSPVLTTGSVIPMTATAAEVTKDRREHLPRPADRGGQSTRPLLRGDGDQRLRRPGRGGVAQG